MNPPLITFLLLAASATPGAAQTYALDFTDSGWTSDSTGLSSEFQTNGGSSGNHAGWDSTHSLPSIGGSGIGAALTINHQPHAWNLETRPALAPYFPSANGSPGTILRSWNNPANLDPGELPSFTLIFSGAVNLHSFGLEGIRNDDAWRVIAYDAFGHPVTPNWADPNLVSVTNPGEKLDHAPINILSTTGVNGATGAEAMGAGRYDAADKAYIVWNANNVFERAAAVIDYNGAEVHSVIFEMIEVDTLNGQFVGTAADQSMYLGSGLIFQSVPEPSTAGLMLLGGMTLLYRRRS